MVGVSTDGVGYCRAVNGHFKHDYGRPWKEMADKVLPGYLAGIVGQSFSLRVLENMS